MSNRARKERKRRGEKFVKAPKTPTTPYRAKRDRPSFGMIGIAEIVAREFASWPIR